MVFSFGGASTPAPAPTTGASAPATGSFSFGASTASAPAAQGPASGGFSFGSTPAPNNENKTAAPSTGGFSFGGTPAPAAASGTNSTSAPAPTPTASGFSFGGSSTSVPVANSNTGGFSSVGVSTSTNTNNVVISGSNLTIPVFSEVFPNLAAHTHVESILKDMNDPSIQHTDLLLNGQNLIHILSDGDNTYGGLLSKPRVIQCEATGGVGSSTNNPKSVILPNESTPIPLPPSILNTIQTISNMLHIPLEQAASLYKSCILDTLESGCDQTLGDEYTTLYFQKRHQRPNSLGSSFVDNSIEFHDSLGCYYCTNSEYSSDEIIKKAMNLYFLERGMTLHTIEMLIQYRLSALEALQGGKQNELDFELAEIVFKSTNQLFDLGLVKNIVEYIEEMTKQNEILKKKICDALDKRDIENNNSGDFASTQTTSTFGGGGNFPQPLQQQALAPVITDADYAMYEYTLEQRQQACRCLFYLAYHTQVTIQEVICIIDLIQDLTNGEKVGLGSGLPILDPVRDVIDPYIITSAEASRSMSDRNFSNMRGNGSAPPQPTKTAKNHQQWKEELLKSLCSVRGLKKATVTTAHADYRGQYLYHSMTLDSHNTQGSASVKSVDGGKPQLLECISSLIMTLICSFDGKNTLVERALDSNNHVIINTENKILPLNSVQNIEQILKPIIDRLDPSSTSFANWKRQDIAGVLSASFALLIRPALDTSASPSYQSGAGLEFLKDVFRSCLESPTIVKSITLTRTSLIPCLGDISMKSSSPTLDNDFSFYMSVISDFTSQYLDAICSFGDLPVSRQKWMHQEEDELQLRYVQEKQRKQLEEWSGKMYNATVLPTEVDISKRPDCLDDIIALAVHICTLCPDCSHKFWTVTQISDDVEEKTVYRLLPSLALKKLEKAHMKDPSLLAVYASFLSALSFTNDPNDVAIGNDGASAIFYWMNDNTRLKSSPTSFNASKHVNWQYLLYSIQWYTDKLSVSDNENGNSTWSNLEEQSKQTSISNSDNTSYYYGADDNSSKYSISSKEKKIDSTLNTSSTLPSTSQKRGLDEKSNMILSSFLVLLSQVALRSEECKRKILSMKMKSRNSRQSSFAEEDDVISILFDLVMTPIAHTLKGLVLSTISNFIVSPSKGNQTAELQNDHKDVVMKCWEMLESSQIIPIAKLGQYSPLANSNIPTYSQSSSAKEKNNWLPPSEEFGIMYDLEYIEAKKGIYSTTEGFLKLLAALFSSNIIPCDLGSSWRPQQGCAPYIEYVTDFLLPRIFQSENQSPLYFASPADKFRLLSRSLEVVDAVLCGYSPLETNISRSVSPPGLITESSSSKDSPAGAELSPLKSIKLSGKAAKARKLQNDISTGPFELVASALVSVTDETATEDETLYDHSKDMMQVSQKQSDVNGQLTIQSIPRPKSSGYNVLSEILSSVSSFSDFLIEILVESTLSDSVSPLSDKVLDALFGETSPSFDLAKIGRDAILNDGKRPVSMLTLDSMESDFRALYMDQLLPEPSEESKIGPRSENNILTTSRRDACFWRESCLYLVLKIFCAAGARTELFLRSHSDNFVTFVPTMRFQKRNFGYNQPPHIKNFHLLQLERKLVEKSVSLRKKPDSESFLSIVSQLIGYQSSSLPSENCIGLMAMSLLKFIGTVSSPTDFIRSVFGFANNSDAAVVSSFSSRVAMIPLLKEIPSEIDFCDTILSMVLDSIVDTRDSNQEFAKVLLGISSRTIDQQRKFMKRSSEGTEVDLYHGHNLLDTILDLLSSLEFVIDSITAPLASKCFQIIYHVCKWTSNDDMRRGRLCTMTKLRRSGFWQYQLMSFLASSANSQCLLELVLSNSPSHRQFGEERDFLLTQRDSSLLHSMSWLLKGTSYELHALVGGVDFSEVEFYTSASHPGLCRQLLEILLSKETNVLLNALKNIPLSKPLHLGTELLRNKPSKRSMEYASYQMNGVGEVFRGFTLINESKLCEHLEMYGTSNNIDKAKLWCSAWNSYVQFVCGSSHFANAWTFISSTIFSSCGSILLTDYNIHHGSVYDGECAKNILLTLLKIFETKKSATFSDGRLDIGSVHALSTACIPLSNYILQLHLSNRDEIPVSVSNEDLLSIVQSLISAMSSSTHHDDFTEGLGEEMLLIYSMIISSILESNTALSINKAQDMSSQVKFMDDVIRVCTALTKLSIKRGIDNVEKFTHVSETAQSCLSSILRWLDSLFLHTDHTLQSSLIYKIFTSHQSANSCFAQLVDSIDRGNTALTDLLESIACCNGGTDLLVETGITKKILSIGSLYRSSIVSAQMKYGHEESQYPDFLADHISLLNMMFASASSEYTLQRLVNDASTFVRVHIESFEDTFKNYPRNEALLEDFIRTIVFISSPSKQNCKTDLHRVLDEKSLIRIRNLTSQFSMHILQHPFPEFLLPYLPRSLSTLGNQEQVGNWWEAIPEEKDKSSLDSFVLPYPPCGNTFSSMATTEDTKKMPWTLKFYNHVIQAFKCADLSLSFLLNSSVDVEFTSLAISLHRSIEALFAIDSRLSILKGNDGISSMMTFTNITDENNIDQVRITRQLEMNSLQAIMESLSTIVPKLLLTIKESTSRTFTSLQNHSCTTSILSLKSSSERLYDVLNDDSIKHVIERCESLELKASPSSLFAVINDSKNALTIILQRQ